MRLPRTGAALATGLVFAAGAVSCSAGEQAPSATPDYSTSAAPGYPNQETLSTTQPETDPQTQRIQRILGEACLYATQQLNAARTRGDGNPDLWQPGSPMPTYENDFNKAYPNHEAYDFQTALEQDCRPFAELYSKNNG